MQLAHVSRLGRLDPEDHLKKKKMCYAFTQKPGTRLHTARPDISSALSILLGCEALRAITVIDRPRT